MNDGVGCVQVMPAVWPRKERDFWTEISSIEPSSLPFASNSQGWGPKIEKTHQPEHAIRFTDVQNTLHSDDEKEQSNHFPYVQQHKLKTEKQAKERYPSQPLNLEFADKIKNGLKDIR